jgi:UDP-N-acetylmuramoylalanine--D-glutamate ligase
MSFDTFRQAFTGKKVLLFGFGLLGGGKGSLKLFQSFPCQITITDQKSEDELKSTLSNIDHQQIDHFTLGKHLKEDIDWADVIVKNPAVPTENEFIQYAISQHKHVTTDAALYIKYAQAQIIGITGTRGKTTTTLLTHHLISNSLHKKILLGGNIKDTGSLPLLLSDSPDTIAILELSSFALEGCHWEKISPQIAAITNLYPDHLNRHPTMEQYAFEKSAIFAYQHTEDHVFLNRENEWTTTFEKSVHSQLHLVDPSEVSDARLMPLRGQHNLWNAAFAISIAKAVGVSDDEIRQHLPSFTGAPYRQQRVGSAHGTTFINDSTSTTPESLMVALETFPEATFIIGGTTKQLNLAKLATQLRNHKGKHYYLKGTGTSELLEQLGKTESVFDSLQAAFSAAVEDKPQTLVFSPGFTSFELFNNEFDRAEQFDRLVQQYSES